MSRGSLAKSTGEIATDNRMDADEFEILWLWCHTEPNYPLTTVILLVKMIFYMSPSSAFIINPD